MAKSFRLMNGEKYKITTNANRGRLRMLKELM
jgi:hypothetical protein